MLEIKKGKIAKAKKEAKQTETNNTVEDVKAVQDYNILMGNLDDPMEVE